MEFKARVVGHRKIDPSKRVIVDHQRLVEADFSGRTLEQFVAIGSHFDRCRFDKLRTDGASLGAGRDQSEYVDCSFDRVRFRLGPGGVTRFVRCSFEDVRLKDWFCFQVELVDCVFSGTLKKGWFNGSVPNDRIEMAGRARNEFSGNDFSGMELIDVEFRTGIDLTRQRLPSGRDYLYIAAGEEAVRRARSQVIEWSNLDTRREAMAFIESLEWSLRGGQVQLLLRRKDYPRSAPAIDAVFELLAATS
jgi:hypothetical protein